MFFEKTSFTVAKEGYDMTLVPERLRGEMATFEIKIKKKVLVEEGKRITARHIRELEKAGVTALNVPEDYLYEKHIAHDIINKETGEIVATANQEITPEELHETLAPEFMEELMTYGKIYGYRYRPEGRIFGKPIDEYKGITEARAMQVMIENNLISRLRYIRTNL